MGEFVVILLVASKTVAFGGDLLGEAQAVQAFELLVQAVDVLISVQQGSFPHPTYCLAPKDLLQYNGFLPAVDSASFW